MGCCIVAYAQQLNIHTTTQGIVSIAFAEQPKITFSADDVMTVTSSTLTLDFPYSEVEKITFDDNVTPVQTLTVREGNTQLLIYDLSGKLVRQATSHDGTASVNLSSLKPGVYVVKDGKRTYKIRKP